jgi:hypothetical protein
MFIHSKTGYVGSAIIKKLLRSGILSGERRSNVPLLSGRIINEMHLAPYALSYDSFLCLLGTLVSSRMAACLYLSSRVRTSNFLNVTKCTVPRPPRNGVECF